MTKAYSVKWYDNKVIDLSEKKLCEILTEFGLVAEGASKKELKKGHGVLTGTLRRSVHLATPDYRFSNDKVEPSKSSPERGGSEVEPKETEKGKFVLVLGSGMPYALKIHQGWSGFEGYHYIRNGIDIAKKQKDAIIKRHQVSS